MTAMSMSESPLFTEAGDGLSIAQERSLWLSQAATPPSLQFGKNDVFARTLELLRLIAAGEASDLNASPRLVNGSKSRTWQHYAAALRAMGVAENRRGLLYLTPEGDELVAGESRTPAATLIARRTRLFAEALGALVTGPLTIEEVNSQLVHAYRLEWATLSNTRTRLTWLEVLGLIEWLGDRRLAATPTGAAAYETWQKVTPAAVLAREDAEAADLPDTPIEIAALLEQLSSSDEAQDARKTYNIWVPSPASDPSKIENMRTSVGAAAEPIDKDALLSFIADRFGLKRSSVESMLPFMRAGGFLQEVRRGVFVATPAARAWLNSGADIDFVRILHCNMRFIGELMDCARESTPRSEVYRSGALFGMNQDKIRWLVAFLIEAGLLIETSWSSIEATATGRALTDTLPLAVPPSRSAPPPHAHAEIEDAATTDKHTGGRAGEIADQLRDTAVDPSADGKSAGAAFEITIEQAFSQLGFRAQRISGSGDTDVLVQWYDRNHTLRTAIVDGKSTASGQIAHNSISDVAITTHKEKNAADYVAIVAQAFAGNTIRDMAAKKGWALVTAVELGEMVVAADALGLRPADVGLLFETPDGLSRVASLIESRRRELDLVSLVIARLRDEMENEEAVSPRDISLIERRSELAPTIDELISAFGLLVTLDADIVRVVDSSPDTKHETYQIGDVRSAANRLRALATAMERGL